MMLTHFAHQAIDGSWHTVYRVPGTGALHSVLDALSERAAKAEAARLNREQARHNAASMAAAVDRSERRIPSGFYKED